MKPSQLESEWKALQNERDALLSRFCDLMKTEGAPQREIDETCRLHAGATKRFWEIFRQLLREIE